MGLESAAVGLSTGSAPDWLHGHGAPMNLNFLVCAVGPESDSGGESRDHVTCGSWSNPPVSRNQETGGIFPECSALSRDKGAWSPNEVVNGGLNSGTQGLLLDSPSLCVLMNRGTGRLLPCSPLWDKLFEGQLRHLLQVKGTMVLGNYLSKDPGNRTRVKRKFGSYKGKRTYLKLRNV